MDASERRVARPVTVACASCSSHPAWSPLLGQGLLSAGNRGVQGDGVSRGELGIESSEGGKHVSASSGLWQGEAGVKLLGRI